MKCNKIKISSVYSSVINSNIIIHTQKCQEIHVEKLRPDSVLHSLKERKRAQEIDPSKRCQSEINGRTEDPREHKQVGFLHFWDLFGSISS